MKVYLLWEIRHHLVYTRNVLKGIYTTREKAEAEMLKLEEASVHPLVEDDYGPISGDSYAVHENEVTE